MTVIEKMIEWLENILGSSAALTGTAQNYRTIEQVLKKAKKLQQEEKKVNHDSDREDD